MTFPNVRQIHVIKELKYFESIIIELANPTK